MCIDHKIICRCGSQSASFNFKDEIVPVKVVDSLFCPLCSSDIDFNPDTMLKDNGWIIEYNMDIARFTGQKLPAVDITPEFLFDEGYCTWRGVSPTDHINSVREREELLKLSKIDTKMYFKEFKKWGIERMAQLANEGWRKAYEKHS